VVLDAPPTGRIARFLNVNTEVAGLARVGPIRNQSDSIMRLLRSPQTVVHFVTLLEEMPVQETCDGVEALREIELRLGAVVVNAMRAPVLRHADLTSAAKGRLDRDALVAGLRTAGLDASHAAFDGVVDGLLAEAAEHAERVRDREARAQGHRRARPPDVRAAASLQRHRPRRALRLAARLRAQARHEHPPGARLPRRRPPDAHTSSAAAPAASGKTTTACSAGTARGELGRYVVVLTIDPAGAWRSRWGSPS
jgi:hypothetical protein